MRAAISNDFLTNRAWLRSVVDGKDMILRNVSALEYLEMFNGYIHEEDIEVYARQKGDYENVRYCVVDSFEGIEYVKFGGVMCSTLNQAINDMLGDYENMDSQALVESLSEYYYTHNSSFEGLKIKQANKEKFDEIKEWAIDFYCGG